jgi:hypothetical protein
MKSFIGIPANFKGMGWSSDLKKINISVQYLFNPFTNELGLNYKRNKESWSIVFDGTDIPENINSKVREFEIEKFQIPEELSKYT